MTQQLQRLYSIEVDVPVHIVSEMNSRDHWRTRAKRFACQKEAVHYTLRSLRVTLMRIAECSAVVVTMTRYGRGLLDEDNLAGGFKAVQDQVATELGMKDDPASRIVWLRRQQKAKTYHCGIRIEGINA